METMRNNLISLQSVVILQLKLLWKRAIMIKQFTIFHNFQFQLFFLIRSLYIGVEYISVIIIKMGATCIPQKQKKAQFTAFFSANLRELFDYYKSLLQYLKPSNVFSSSSQQLTQLVETYLSNPKAFQRADMGLCSVDSVHKLHPLDYGTEKVTKQWLIQACLRQNTFIQEFPYEILNFQESYRHYVQFLYMCYKSPESIIVPNKLADFMWHSHMQDNYRYRNDCMKMLNKVLNHLDDFIPDQLQKHAKQTELARQRLLRVPERKLVSAPNSSSSNIIYHNYAFINYGPGICGGGHFPNPGPDPSPDRRSSSSSSHSDKGGHHPHPPHPHPDQKDHHHDHHHKDHHHNENHHHNHNDNTYTHHVQSHGGYVAETNNHSSCGGGGANSCGGGGASSCGGGASSCGGGGSSCGGGGGD